ncbi:hypothetical protein ACSBR2_014057 [Camellia fascicularis]
MERSNYGRGGRGGGGGGRGGRGGGGRGGVDRQYQGGGGRGGGWGRGSTFQQPTQQWGPRPQPPPPRPESAESSTARGGGRGAWGRPAPAHAHAPAPVPVPVPVPVQSQRAPAPRSDPSIPDISSLKISSGSNLLPVRRPDTGGTLAIQSPQLIVNHFPVRFNEKTIIIHYDIDIKPDVSSKSRPARVSKSVLSMVKDKLFSDDPAQFPLSRTAYDGERNVFSAVPLPTGTYKVDFSGREDMKSGSYTVTIKHVNELELGKLKEYLSGKVLSIPRDVLQGMDLVMKENPSRHRICAGRGFYSATSADDLGGGIIASKGFQQSLKPTSQGLALCLDYSVLAFRKRLPVIDFLKEHVRGFRGVNDVTRLRTDVKNALEGLKVTVNHRITKQKYTIAGLTDRSTRDLSFDDVDPEGKAPPRRVSLVEYFRGKYGKEIMYKAIPSLDLGKNGRINYVPMEFCILVEGQRFPKENLHDRGAKLLKEMSLIRPAVRRKTICEMVQAEDGPCGGNVARGFDIEVIKDMTMVKGRVIGPPQLKLRAPDGNLNAVSVDRVKCHWNLVRRSVVEGKPVQSWALLDFSSSDLSYFVPQLIKKCNNLGIRMNEPLVYRSTNMRPFSDIDQLRSLIENVIKEANEKYKSQLQIVVCVMDGKHPGYKSLKWLTETQIGILTQCCLSNHAYEAKDQYLANLALKINAKLGGSNVELNQRLPHFDGEGHVMFVGADVNHPAARNSTCPSMAAVVATLNWPAANRYAARVCPQYHRKENILNFGVMCQELIQTYAQINKVKPARIVVFRDGVSEGQFDMVLNEELLDLKMAIYEEHYRPTITLVVAQKRHQTRLFPESMKDGSPDGNVVPGTVVDTVITHPYDFDFYLCSHYGSMGTSKPTHYYVLWDEHNFTSDQLQKLIYDMCFTFARCTKPVSLVPPVYYADLVAFRGRMFQEVVMKLPPGSASSSSSSSSSSHAMVSITQQSASFDEKFYKLHPELENIMFFI